MLVIDIFDPADPRITGKILFGGGFAEGIAVSGDVAYVAAGSAGLRVVDISDPEQPREVGVYPPTATAVAVSGSRAFVVQPGGLQIVDVSNPSIPVPLGFAELGESSDVEVSGGYAFVASEIGMKVVDVSSPSAPHEVQYVNVLHQTNALAISGTHAYVAASEGGLMVIDIVDPLQPNIVSFDHTRYALDVAVDGNHAYLVDPQEGFRVIDISTPTEPERVGLYDIHEPVAVAASENHAYLTSGYDGVRVIDVSTPSEPVGTGSVVWLTRDLVLFDVEVDGSSAFVVGGSGGLVVLDVSAPSAPVEVGYTDTVTEVYDVEVSGDYAYLAAGPNGLRVVDVSVRWSPFEAGFLATPGVAIDVAVSGDYAYVAAEDAGLRVVDVSSPTDPVAVGSLEMAGLVVDVELAGGHAYVVGSQGLLVVDISSPSEPGVVGGIDLGYSSAVAVSEDYAYVAGGGDFHVIDISTPTAPVEVGIFESGGYMFGDMEAAEDYVYAASDNFTVPSGFRSQIKVFDVSEPMAPEEVGYADVPDLMVGLDVSRGYVYSASFLVLQIFREAGLPPVSDFSTSFIPAAALAAGAEDSFFETEVEINNPNAASARVLFHWLPTASNNAEPISSYTYTIRPGESRQWPNALESLFDLGPDAVGAIAVESDSPSLIGMSRTFNSPGGETAGTFGQALPLIQEGDLIDRFASRRIILMSQGADVRANLGCVNGSTSELTVNVSLYDSQGTPLETMDLDLPPWSHHQINRIFGDHAPIDGYVDVSTATSGGRFYCYGSVLDNETSDPTTILPLRATDSDLFIPAAAYTEGAEGSFFQTDLELNNSGTQPANYSFRWLPRGEDNTDPVRTDRFNLEPGMGIRIANVLPEIFGLEPNSVGAIFIDSFAHDLVAMSRIYNLPGAETGGTYGQGLPGVYLNAMVPTGVKKRIIFMRENDEYRANLGCINGVTSEVIVTVDLFDSDGVRLETKYMALPPWSSKQANRIFQDYAPVNGYVDVWTDTPDSLIYCYGSVLDNITSDPTTILPQ
jgi:hypothetical protein